MNKSFSIFTSNQKNTTAIIPSSNISGKALVAVISIMTFLSSFTLIGVDLIHRAAKNWSNQISYEATIQIRPVDNVDINKTLRDAVQLVKTFSGVQDAKIVDQKATEKLLEPWFGTGFNFKELPLPRLIIVTLKGNETINFSAINHAIKTQIPGGQFDDHRIWVHRFATMAHTTVFIGLSILALVLGSLMLTIIFSTRNALAENAHIINVLYFLGTETLFIARQFAWHFFKTSLRGALFGGFTSIFLFLVFCIWTNYNLGRVEASQVTALFGHISMNSIPYGKIIFLIIFVSFVTTLTNHMTILTQLKKIDQCENGLF
ncbi:cell division transport system permease protein [Bartonella fuyuanensis]|uniref:Cell division transport system permease protein n=1 Tax=Bartonella fuyuanensis TaxID=1460968 RepID=A0A840DW56_9HYPH|nr:ABC transporter permease [Bartonella fuyuanensis]MBB4075762.1 cell division transport system permease protein [Bartonella fuyuanensis]